MGQLVSLLIRFVLSIFRMILGPKIKISEEPERSVVVRFEEGKSTNGKRLGLLVENDGLGDAGWCSPQVSAVWYDGQLVDNHTSRLQWSSTQQDAMFSPRPFPSDAKLPIEVFGTDFFTRTLQIKSEKEKSSAGHRFSASGVYTVDIRIQLDVWTKSRYVRLHAYFDNETLNINILKQPKITWRKPKARPEVTVESPNTGYLDGAFTATIKDSQARHPERD